MEIFQGREGFGSIAIGKIHILDDLDAAGTEFDCDRELERYQKAVGIVMESLNADHENVMHEPDHRKAHDIELQKSILTEHQFNDAVTGRILNQRCRAEEAVQGAGSYFEDVYANMQQGAMRPSRSDMRTVSDMLTNFLDGNSALIYGIDEPCIIAAGDLSAHDFLQIDRHKLLGLIVEASGSNSHMAILAKATGIPCIFGCEIESSWDGRDAILDGGWRAIYIDPDKGTQNDMRERLADETREEKKLQKLKGVECVTLDGVRVKLFGNISCPEDVEKLKFQDAEGVGLYRSEMSYVNRKTPPSEQELFEEYRSLAVNMNGKPVIIRTLDLGSDKYVPYIPLTREKCPALGLRGIRLSLKYPEIFRTQLRALLRAGVYGNISVMYPMVTSVKELIMAQDIMDQAKKELDQEGAMFKEIKTGTIIETPAAVLISDELAKNTSFFSIGTNDLTQYALGVDRENSELADVCDYHHPAVMKMIRITVHNAQKSSIPVGVCGELASDPKLTHFFLELGVDSLSVIPSDILKLRNNIVNMTVGTSVK